MREAVAREGHRERAPVGRPGGSRIVAAEGRHRTTNARRELMHVDNGLAVLEAHVGELLAVRRPGRRNDGLGRLKRRSRHAAVAVGNDEFVAPSASCAT